MVDGFHYILLLLSQAKTFQAFQYQDQLAYKPCDCFLSPPGAAASSWLTEAGRDHQQGPTEALNGIGQRYEQPTEK